MPSRHDPKGYQALSRRVTRLEHAVFGDDDDGGSDDGDPTPQPPDTTLTALDERLKRIETDDPVTRKEFDALFDIVNKMRTEVAG